MLIGQCQGTDARCSPYVLSSCIRLQAKVALGDPFAIRARNETRKMLCCSPNSDLTANHNQWD
jgi:hypothetical protein